MSGLFFPARVPPASRLFPPFSAFSRLSAVQPSAPRPASDDSGGQGFRRPFNRWPEASAPCQRFGSSGDRPPPSNAGTPRRLSAVRPSAPDSPRLSANAGTRASRPPVATIGSGQGFAPRPVSGLSAIPATVETSNAPRRRKRPRPSAVRPWQTSKRRAACLRFDRPRRIPATIGSGDRAPPVSGSTVATVCARFSHNRGFSRVLALPRP